ncbi:MAG: type II toxin-antitoxin system PemK/MazF family toxin [Candidatus Hydrogenedentes bacterium]|nr:type II toxin-antitoxin system PemK/MazF family toxin [Candidatus Hydrogenedentota bacterium]
MTSTVEFGEIYVCSFPFTSGQGAKARPVLILRDLDPDCLVCRITSIPHRGLLDLQVCNWEEAGLKKPSTIRLSRLVTVEKTILKVRIGRPDRTDLDRVRVIWNEKFRL